MPFMSGPETGAIPLMVVSPDRLDRWRAGLPALQRGWVEANGFEARLGETLALPETDGSLAGAVCGWGAAEGRARDRFHLAGAASRLPPGRYALVADGEDLDLRIEALGWRLGAYQFDRYKARAPARAELLPPPGVDVRRLDVAAGAAALAQDLINTPARDMGPDALEAAARDVAALRGAELRVTTGPELADGFPLIAAVGAAAAAPPRLVELQWGRRGAPEVTLVGKGITFDTGGLDIKPSSSMALMKKDMAGAAIALGLADMAMALGLDLRLRVLLPIAENAISAPALRPGDVLRSRKGLAVEVNNTDAEGRLVLADALAYADESAPALIVSLATLTGAARVALGPDVPALFVEDDALAAAIAIAAATEADPLWRLPFWSPYEALIEPEIADLDNAPAGGMAGAITAALFLRRFVSSAPFVHVDLYGWTPVAKPGRPKGGAFQAARALLAVMESRFCSRT